MVDQDVILAKADAIEKYLKRIQKVSDITLQSFLNDIDTQDIVLFNIVRKQNLLSRLHAPELKCKIQ
ncbi:MAG: hypothetical protein SWH68_11380 [Thermodesulfobacteriota bacterium]|nr:hypothetical protein [Thermodesulfobacteriota bacterium]